MNQIWIITTECNKKPIWINQKHVLETILRIAKDNPDMPLNMLIIVINNLWVNAKIKEELELVRILANNFDMFDEKAFDNCIYSIINIHYVDRETITNKEPLIITQDQKYYIEGTLTFPLVFQENIEMDELIKIYGTDKILQLFNEIAPKLKKEWLIDSLNLNFTFPENGYLRRQKKLKNKTRLKRREIANRFKSKRTKK